MTAALTILVLRKVVESLRRVLAERDGEREEMRTAHAAETASYNKQVTHLMLRANEHASAKADLADLRGMVDSLSERNETMRRENAQLINAQDQRVRQMRDLEQNLWQMRDLEQSRQARYVRLSEASSQLSRDHAERGERILELTRAIERDRQTAAETQASLQAQLEQCRQRTNELEFRRVSGPCQTCGVDTKHKCTMCAAEWYCCREHQLYDAHAHFHRTNGACGRCTCPHRRSHWTLDACSSPPDDHA